MNDNNPPSTDTPLVLKTHGDPIDMEKESKKLRRDGWQDYTLVFWLDEMQQSVIQQVTAENITAAILGCASALASDYKLNILKIVPCAVFAGSPEPLSIAAAFGMPPETETIKGTAEHVDLATTETKGTA